MSVARDKGGIMAERDEYFLGYRRAEQERLQRQAEELGHEAAWLFDQIALRPGSRVLEIGCGPRGCLDLLAARVGPAGSVIGIERSEESVKAARAFVAEHGLRNVEVHCGDARSAGLPRVSFDLVTARLVLVNVPHPEQIVSEAVGLTRPGGSVAFHEVDWAAMICDPPNQAWTEFIELLVAYTKENGNDLFVGRKVPRLLREAGLVDVQARAITHVHPPGDARRALLLDFADNLREPILALRLIDAQAFADLREALRRHIENPEALVMHGPYVQVWGRMPQ
jgi:ubiquinone/menaquinone biosynthesis C-methylase UbiE